MTSQIKGNPGQVTSSQLGSNTETGSLACENESEGRGRGGVRCGEEGAMTFSNTLLLSLQKESILNSPAP